MKEFFEQCLRDLQQLTGLRQYIEICNKPSQKEAEEEMNVIVRGMVMVSEKFTYIPQDAQKRIVRHQMVSDGEMYALNAKMVYKWFNSVSDKYWKESGHMETNELIGQESNAKPLSEETQKMINEFMANLSTGTIKEVPKVSEYEITKIKIEDSVRQSGALSKGYPQPSQEEIEKKQLHVQYIKENYELITGKKKETWVSEEEWLKLKEL